MTAQTYTVSTFPRQPRKVTTAALGTPVGLNVPVKLPAARPTPLLPLCQPSLSPKSTHPPTTVLFWVAFFFILCRPGAAPLMWSDMSFSLSLHSRHQEWLGVKSGAMDASMGRLFPPSRGGWRGRGEKIGNLSNRFAAIPSAIFPPFALERVQGEIERAQRDGDRREQEELGVQQEKKKVRQFLLFSP